MKRVRVAVTLVVELDQDAWAEYQGIATDGVRADVRAYVLNLVQQSVFLEEASGTVELRTSL